MRYAFGVALLALVIHGSLSSADAVVRPAPSGESGSAALQTASHDLAVNYVSLVGPAAINISDTNGRYMWVLSALRNNSDLTESISFGLAFGGDMPDGCTRAETLVLPGQTSMLVATGEQKTLIWRVRYQCHSPVAPQVVRQLVTVAVTHCSPVPEPSQALEPTDTPEPSPTPVTSPVPEPATAPVCENDGLETNLENNSAMATKQVLIQ